MMLAERSSCLMAAVLWLLCSGYGQSQPQPDKCQAEIPILVLNKLMQPVIIDSSQLDLEIAGKSGLSQIAADPGPRRIVLVYDISASQQDRQAITVGYEAIAHVLRAIPTSSQVGLIVFDQAVRIQVSPQEGRRKAVEALKSEFSRAKEWHGRTALFDSLSQAADLFGSPRRGDSIAIFTDGLDTRSRMTRHQVTRMLQDRGIRVFPVLVLGSEVMRSPFAIRGANDLKDLAKDTGGIFIPLLKSHSTLKDLLQDCDALGGLLAQRSVVRVSYPSSPKRLKLTIKLTKYEKNDASYVIHPPILPACKRLQVH